MKIAFFLSDHGYGHLMRNLPVAAELLKRGHEITIVTGEQQGTIAAQYLRGDYDRNGQGEPRAVRDRIPDGLRIIAAHTDAGLIVMPGTLRLDREATAARVREHIDLWPRLMSGAPDADTYVVDICPWALAEAKARGIRSFLMASFTWVEQYEPFLPEDLLQRYRDAFGCTDRVLYYDLANASARKLLGEGREIGFVARPFTDRVRRIRERHGREIVYLSLGASNSGLDHDIDVSGLPYDFITTQSLRLLGDNVEYLDAGVPNTQDYVAAADYCIAKAGWSTVSELMIAGKRFALLNRPDVPEDTMTISELVRRKAGIAIDTGDLRDMGGVMDALRGYDRSGTEYPNNSKTAAERIENMEKR